MCDASSLSITKFIANVMKENCKFSELENIKKVYNNHFDILIYKHGKKTNTIIIDKRNSKNIVYNNIDIAYHHLSK